MKVTVQDSTIFNKLTMRIEAESLEEICGLIATFNVSTDKRMDSIPNSFVSKAGNAIFKKGIALVEMPLFDAIHPVYKRIQQYKGVPDDS